MSVSRAPRSPQFFAFLALVLVAAACKGETPPPARSDSAVAPATPADPQAPDSFRVAFETSRGNFVIDVRRALSPKGADRFHALVKDGYFTDARFFRVMPGFVAQFGMHPDPAVNAKWAARKILDEPVRESNKRGTIVFAMAGPNTRGNQFFINFADNLALDEMGFSPFGRVVEGMKVVDGIYGGYGEAPVQSLVAAEGNAYLTREFPKLDFIKSATIVGDGTARE